MRALPVTCLLLLITATSCSRQTQGMPAGTWALSEITYYLNPEANDVSEEAVRAVFREWDERTHFSFVYGGRNRAGLIRDGKSTVSFLTRWPSGVPAKTAYCSTWQDRAGNIVEADIILNCGIARFTTRGTMKPDSYILEGVLSHEIGHLIGLGHIEDEDSLMKSMSPQAESYRGGAIDDGTMAAYGKLYGLEDGGDER